MDIDEIRGKLRTRLTEYRQFKIQTNTKPSIHVNAIDIALSLIDYAIEDNRKIRKDEEGWFKAGFYLIQTFENTDWEDIVALYLKLVGETEKRNYFRT
jgi:hypothetical protein